MEKKSDAAKDSSIGLKQPSPTGPPLGREALIVALGKHTLLPFDDLLVRFTIIFTLLDQFVMAPPL